MEKIKKTRKLLNILKAYIKLFGRIETKYYKEIHKLEKMMEHETGIKNIEFVFCDGEVNGIGTPSEPERMELILRNKLE